mgnify:CR=1 FL=1
MNGERGAAIARWVRQHPKEVRPAIGAAFLVVRELPIAPWLLADEARKIRRDLLLARLREIDCVRFGEIPSVVAAYQAAVDGRRQATDDPLEATFVCRLRSLVDIHDDPDDPEATYKAWLRWRFEQRRRRLARRQMRDQTCPHPRATTRRWRPCPTCAEGIRWSVGEYFASVDDAPSVVYGEIVRVIEQDRILVRIYLPTGPSFLDEYGSWPALLSCRLTRQQMDRAAQLGWPASVETLRQTQIAGAA